MKYVKGCLALIILGVGAAVFLGLIAAGIGLGWDLVTR